MRAGRSSFFAAALAVLGSQLAEGAAAWSSKVAFVQHGLAEGEDAVMHAPSTTSSRLASMTPQLLSSAIARVMSLDARAEVETGLPAGDIFNRPDANVLVFVDGLRHTGTARGRDGLGTGAGSSGGELIAAVREKCLLLLCCVWCSFVCARVVATKWCTPVCPSSSVLPLFAFSLDMLALGSAMMNSSLPTRMHPASDETKMHCVAFELRCACSHSRHVRA